MSPLGTFFPLNGGEESQNSPLPPTSSHSKEEDGPGQGANEDFSSRDKDLEQLPEKFRKNFSAKNQWG
jgi:hypothetical protein